HHDRCVGGRALRTALGPEPCRAGDVRAGRCARWRQADPGHRRGRRPDRRTAAPHQQRLPRHRLQPGDGPGLSPALSRRALRARRRTRDGPAGGRFDLPGGVQLQRHRHGLARGPAADPGRGPSRPAARRAVRVLHPQPRLARVPARLPLSVAGVVGQSAAPAGAHGALRPRDSPPRAQPTPLPPARGARAGVRGDQRRLPRLRHDAVLRDPRPAAPATGRCGLRTRGRGVRPGRRAHRRRHQPRLDHADRAQAGRRRATAGRPGRGLSAGRAAIRRMPGHPALALPPPPLQRPLLVGYSGGLDSTVLLHLLARDPAHGSPRAIHVHHGLQPAADAWADHCQRTCAALGIGLAVVRVEVARGTGEGLEAAARRARMDAFARALEDGGVLALAHHQDDQAETFLLRALRASGSEGLGAMRPWRRFGRGWLWRPLLDLPRQALVDYARDHGLDWIEDPSNASDVHDRNYLRRRVLPLLRARWPRADAALARAAALQRETTDLLDAGDRQALTAARSVDPACLQATSLAGLPAPRRARVLRRWIAELALPPLPARGLDQVEGWLRDPPSTAAAAFAWHGAELRLWRGLL